MKHRTIAVALTVLFALPSALPAQDAEEDDAAPPTLRLSFFQCNFGDFGPETQEELEGRVIPVWDELVDEEMIESAGYFFHSWADEWNVGFYTIAEDIPAVLSAQQEFNRRMGERYPDAESSFNEACPFHRDNFYVFGPQTGDDDEEDDDDGN